MTTAGVLSARSPASNAVLVPLTIVVAVKLLTVSVGVVVVFAKLGVKVIGTPCKLLSVALVGSTLIASAFTDPVAVPALVVTDVATFVPVPVVVIVDAAPKTKACPVFVDPVIALNAVDAVAEDASVQFVLTPEVSVQDRVILDPGMIFNAGSAGWAEPLFCTV